ncbi:nucleotidyl transferase AbiEii/AbiGii toxin family protein [Candidatus Micrarchaeota archaeon]|nr:nucleotidyl transferase AbiEii/AbiGii toxin family protein [Candidatus Micrarchaeota archaeon]
MMSSDELARAASSMEFNRGIVEKDYALTWLLKSIYSSDKLSRFLLFKGGTCLSKVYFPETWRLSEDLDFTLTESSLQPDKLKEDIEEQFKVAEDTGGPEFWFDEFHTNPGRIKAEVKFRGPLQQTSLIKVDIAREEAVVYGSEEHLITPKYSDLKPFKVTCYAIQELLVEKLRAIMQRGYTRDYFDVWKLLSLPYNSLRFNDLSHVRTALKEKCDKSKVSYEPELIFNAKRLAEAQSEWEKSLSRVINEPPSFKKVIGDLSEKLAAEKALSTLEYAPSERVIRELIYAASGDGLDIMRRAIDLLKKHLESSNVHTVEVALDCLNYFSTQFIVTTGWAPATIRRIAEPTIRSLMTKPDETIRLKSDQLLKLINR